MAPMDERSEKILTVAMGLAERDGYDAVRLRDLAAEAGVALGTVYKRFRSKEDILAGALELLVVRMQEGLSHAPGKTAEDRLEWFFTTATALLADHPKLAVAMLRTVASGVPEISERVTQFYGRTSSIIVAVYRGSRSDAPPTPDEISLSRILQHVWYASLVGWSAGMHGTDEVVRQVRETTAIVLRGLR
jgi:AcrR family transcriptional regulator